MYKQSISSFVQHDLSIGFDRNPAVSRKQEELSTKPAELQPINNRTIFQLGICLRGVFGFAEHQDNALYRLECLLFSKRNTENDAIHRAAASAAARNSGKARIFMFHKIILI